jgi:hypothetical protein
MSASVCDILGRAWPRTVPELMGQHLALPQQPADQLGPPPDVPSLWASSGSLGVLDNSGAVSPAPQSPAHSVPNPSQFVGHAPEEMFCKPPGADKVGLVSTDDVDASHAVKRVESDSGHAWRMQRPRNERERRKDTDLTDEVAARRAKHHELHDQQAHSSFTHEEPTTRPVCAPQSSMT